ncbi:hypothetical protein YB2330_002849 [Saitoella coloradoensis]
MAPTSAQIDLFGYSFALLTFLGGAIGFIKAGSIASIISASVSALLIAYGASLTSREYENAKMIFWVSLLLLGFFAKRYAGSRKVMPAGLMMILSLISVIRYGQRLYL